MLGLASLAVVTAEQCVEPRLTCTETAKAVGNAALWVSAALSIARIWGPWAPGNFPPSSLGTVFGRQAAPHWGLVPACQGALERAAGLGVLVIDTQKAVPGVDGVQELQGGSAFQHLLDQGSDMSRAQGPEQTLHVRASRPGCCVYKRPGCCGEDIFTALWAEHPGQPGPRNGSNWP